MGSFVSRTHETGKSTVPRQSRLPIADYPHHLIQRGNDRESIVRRDADTAGLLRHLRECAHSAGGEVHACEVMPNRVHLLATPRPGQGLSRMMQCHSQRYVWYFNFEYHNTGTLREGRFKSSVAETARYLLACYRYIELNPVRTGMVARPWDYRWPSCRANAMGEADDPVSRHAEFS